MRIWTTFAPRKVSWELTNITTKGKIVSSDWQKNIDLINDSLRKLKNAGIFGIRLAIFPSELTKNGKVFDWSLVEKMLSLCSGNKLLVDLCIGPFQYPHYPGIYLPEELVKKLSPDSRYIDDDPDFYNYGMVFLKEQMHMFGSDKRIHGFHLANEWPDAQKVEDRRELKLEISEKFMLEAAVVLKKSTDKPILLNTNIDVSNKGKIANVFGGLVDILSKQVRLGFDIYPSQNKWKKVPFQKLKNLILDYPKSFKIIQKQFPQCEMYFAEVEAQPWGSGQSWRQLIREEQDPDNKVLTYSKDSLKKTWDKYIKKTNCQNVSLWGSDFWLAASMMGIKWPLEQIENLVKFSPN